MNRQFAKEAVGWGWGLWLLGYILGFILFFLVPTDLIGWIITPAATVFTLWVLLKKIKGNSISYYAKIGVVWLLIAVVCDYLLLVKLLQPADGYYKIDVYLYYVLTLLLPIAVGIYKINKNEKSDKR